MVTLTATDAAGNTATCVFTVTVVDQSAPSIVCKSASVNLNAAGSASITTGDVFQSGSDNCGTVNLVSVVPSTFNCSNIGTSIVVLTANDGNGNDATCTASVTVADVTPPTVVCQNTTVNLNAAGSGSITTAAVFQNGSDNCGTVNQVSVTPNTFNCSNIGTNLVTLTVNDGHGNTATCTASVNVVDAMAPTVVCKPFTANLSVSGVANIVTSDVFQSGSDNCGTVNQVSVAPSSFGCSNIGANTVVLTVNDGHGNTATCSAVVTVVDVTPPTILCQNATISLNAAGEATLTVGQINNNSFDNCGLNALGLSKVTFNCSNIGQNSVTLFGRDFSNNMGQCTATVTVVDPIAPVAKCKNVISDIGASGVVLVPAASVDNGSSDNCSFTLSLTPNIFNCSHMGANTVTLRVTDAGGNTATCTAVVTIRDLTGPTARCKNPIVYLDETGHTTLSVAEVDNGSSDACGIASMTISNSSFNCSEISGTQPVILTLRDMNGNTSSCISYVTVKDTVAPKAYCENVTVQLGANGRVTVYPSDLTLESTDNCSVWSFSPIAKIYTSFNLGNNFLTITVKDWSNNASTCVSQVTVLPYTGFNQEEGNRSIVAETGFGIHLYPNPTAGDANLAFELPKEQDFVIRVIDLQGRMVLSHEGIGMAGENTLPIRLGGLAPGIYLVDFKSEGLNVQKRLVVQE
jgi:hypothetical protein